MWCGYDGNIGYFHSYSGKSYVCLFVLCLTSLYGVWKWIYDIWYDTITCIDEWLVCLRWETRTLGLLIMIWYGYIALSNLKCYTYTPSLGNHYPVQPARNHCTTLPNPQSPTFPILKTTLPPLSESWCVLMCGGVIVSPHRRPGKAPSQATFPTHQSAQTYRLLPSTLALYYISCAKSQGRRRQDEGGIEGGTFAKDFFGMVCEFILLSRGC